jgi:predicted DNA-binding ribbon-helix-helix protein
MCEFFVKADPILYESRSRTVRIHGVLTSIRLENLVWDTLSEMANDEGCTTNALIVQFHDEICGTGVMYRIFRRSCASPA